MIAPCFFCYSSTNSEIQGWLVLNRSHFKAWEYCFIILSKIQLFHGSNDLLYTNTDDTSFTRFNIFTPVHPFVVLTMLGMLDSVWRVSLHLHVICMQHWSNWTVGSSRVMNDANAHQKACQKGIVKKRISDEVRAMVRLLKSCFAWKVQSNGERHYFSQQKTGWLLLNVMILENFKNVNWNSIIELNKSILWSTLEKMGEGSICIEMLWNRV